MGLQPVLWWPVRAMQPCKYAIRRALPRARDLLPRRPEMPTTRRPLPKPMGPPSGRSSFDEVMRAAACVFAIVGCWFSVACGSDADDGPGGAGSGTGSGELPACVRECTSPEACAGPDLYNDLDNWACEGGLCRWLGCHDDGECMSIGFVCRENEDTGVKGCQPSCMTAADCVLGELESRSEDNWACEDGACRYTGCIGDQECIADGAEGSACHEQSDGVAACVAACSTPADCVDTQPTAISDADNWTCDGGFCSYRGCTSDDECTAASGKQSACR